MFKVKFFPLSINGYALAFLVLVATLFSGIGWYALISIESAREDIHQSNRQAAVNELNIAVERLLNTLTDISKQIANWDEIFQQLDNPAYYNYWREYRMLSTDVLPEIVQAAEVYNLEGKALTVISDSLFPGQIDPKQLSPSVQYNGEENSLVLYLPIYRDVVTQKPVKGYIGLSIPFTKTLLQQFRFRYLDAETLYLALLGTGEISLEDAITMIDYQLQSSQEAESMMQIVQSTVIQMATIIGILCLLFYILMVFLLGKPLVEISRYIDRLRVSGPGTMGARNKNLFPVKELEKVRNSLNDYHAELKQAQLDLDQKNQELWKQAHHDALTGMLNRRAYDLEWNNARQLLSHHRVGLGLILFDVNHFKAINDTYGHQVGDDVLTAISGCIQNALRKGESLFRIGGDEFAALIVGSGAEDDLRLAQRCIDAVDAYDFASLGIKESVRISCGIAHCEGDQKERLDNLQWQADVAVYQAKRPGVTRPILFHDDMADGTESVFSSWINNAVYEAIIHGTGIEMHYQPVINCRTQKVDYYESLVRIRHEDEMVPPSHIFPVVALRHMETEMDRAIIHKVLEDLQNHHIPAHSGVSINLSAESVTHQSLVNWLLPLADYLETHTLVLEVTETSLITQLNSAAGNLQTLRDMGFKVALDDFGSGYSSLRYLTHMPVDTIKFDISLIQGMEDSRLQKLVEELATMLTDLGYDLVAEGIETYELMQKVKAAGFSFTQGYLCGKPARETGFDKSRVASQC